MNPNAQRTKRSGIMLAYPFEFERLSGPSRKAWNSWPVIVQPKLNGVRCRALIGSEGGVLLISSSGAYIESMPHIKRALLASGLRNIELDGELYHHGMPLQEINARVSRKSLETRHEESGAIEYHVFDAIEQGLIQEERIKQLVCCADLHAPLQQVPFDFAYSLDEIMALLNKHLADGYEGIIVRRADARYERKRSTNMMKFKPAYRDTYRIVGVYEELDKYGDPKHALGALVVRGNDGEEFNVGSGFTREQRQQLWIDRTALVGRQVEVKYHALSKLGIPPASVFSCFAGDADEDKQKGDSDG